MQAASRVIRTGLVPTNNSLDRSPSCHEFVAEDGNSLQVRSIRPLERLQPGTVVCRVGACPRWRAARTGVADDADDATRRNSRREPERQRDEENEHGEYQSAEDDA